MVGSIAYKAASSRLDGGSIAYKRNDRSIIYKADEPIRLWAALAGFEESFNSAGFAILGWEGDEYSEEIAVGSYYKQNYFGTRFRTSYGQFGPEWMIGNNLGIASYQRARVSLSLHIRVNFFSWPGRPIPEFAVFSGVLGSNDVYRKTIDIRSKFSTFRGDGSYSSIRAINTDPGFDMTVSADGKTWSWSAYEGVKRSDVP